MVLKDTQNIFMSKETNTFKWKSRSFKWKLTTNTVWMNLSYAFKIIANISTEVLHQSYTLVSKFNIHSKIGWLITLMLL